MDDEEAGSDDVVEEVDVEEVEVGAELFTLSQ